MLAESATLILFSPNLTVRLDINANVMLAPMFLKKSIYEECKIKILSVCSMRCFHFCISVSQASSVGSLPEGFAEGGYDTRVISPQFKDAVWRTGCSAACLQS